MNAIIHTVDLDLVPLTRAVLAGDFREAGRLPGIAAPTDWDISRRVLELRLSQFEANPELQPWLIRAISLRGDGIIVGDIGFHSALGHQSLAELSPGGTEFGYSVLKP